MSNPFDPNNTGSNVPQEQVVRRERYSRSDIASTRRAIFDLRIQSQRLQESIIRQMGEQSQMDFDTFQTAWEERERLNQLNAQISEIETVFTALIPNLSGSRLSDDEKKQIIGLYDSGLYTQSQLAEQYGITQPSVGDIIRKNRNTRGSDDG